MCFGIRIYGLVHRVVTNSNSSQQEGTNCKEKSLITNYAVRQHYSHGYITAFPVKVFVSVSEPSIYFARISNFEQHTMCVVELPSDSVRSSIGY